MICLTILFVAGFLTVVTETFTRFAVVGTLRDALREFVLQSAQFCLGAVFWGASVWLGCAWLGHRMDPRLLLELLGGAHLPLLAYPLAIFPTVGFRLAQILRFLVYLSLAGGLAFFTPLPLLTTALLPLPGWLLHFLTTEARALKSPGVSP